MTATATFSPASSAISIAFDITTTIAAFPPTASVKSKRSLNENNILFMFFCSYTALRMECNNQQRGIHQFHPSMD